MKNITSFFIKYFFYIPTFSIEVVYPVENQKIALNLTDGDHGWYQKKTDY